MKKISEMTGSELRAFLGIDSVVDRSMEEFDAWDDKHIGADYPKADERRKLLIDAIIHAGFSGIEDAEEAERIGYVPLYSVNLDEDDKNAIAEEIVNANTCSSLFDSISEIIQLPDDLSIDEIVELSRAELVANFTGEWVDEGDSILDEIRKSHED